MWKEGGEVSALLTPCGEKHHFDPDRVGNIEFDV